jgi:hypothetical protein
MLVSADAEHVEILRRGPRIWNAWREQNPTVTPNLTGIRLSASERQMGVMNGGPINLALARLRRAQLRFATLSGANLTGANLTGADLTDARLDGANLASADLSNAILARTDMARADIAGANFCGATLLGVRHLTQGQLDDALGDALTELPPNLARPAYWVDIDAEIETDANDGDEGRTLPKPLSRAKGGTMSWLVGGTQLAPEEQEIK